LSLNRYGYKVARGKLVFEQKIMGLTPPTL
jgi:hypothetical protein